MYIIFLGRFLSTYSSIALITLKQKEEFQEVATIDSLESGRGVTYKL